MSQMILEELPPFVRQRMKRNLSREPEQGRQKQLLDQFLNADAFVI
jgi:hypothetical protein